MSIYWEEDEKKLPYQAPEDIVDISYVLYGKTLPIDHAYALAKAIDQALPWFMDEQDTGIHNIHVAASINGWERPDDLESGVLHLSRRTRMTLRIPKERLKDAEALTGKVLDIDGSQIEVGKSIVKPLSTLPTLFSRYVFTKEGQEEPDFMDYLYNEFNKLDIKARKILCGKQSSFRTPEGLVYTRSVMVADLEPEQSVRLQEKGIGEYRKYGCGMFLPHKGIKPVGDMSEKQHFTGN